MKSSLLLNGIIWLCLCTFQVGGFIEDILFLYKNSTLNLREDFYQNDKPILASYDYVIVGASPSGCAIANRLSADPSLTVLLLEAGPESNAVMDIPVIHTALYNTEYNWNYKSEPNPGVCRGMEGGVCAWPSGRGIGGATTWNGMIYTRGNVLDYDAWALAGNPGWSYADLLPYFRRAESAEPALASSFRGSTGPVPSKYAPFATPGTKAFLQAAKQLGYPEIDYVAPYGEGFAKMQNLMNNGRRVNAATAYLAPVKMRPNLHIVQRAFVTRIVIDPISKEAKGVDFIKKDVLRFVQANREVILSAGAFGSPKLLMLSGIGPKDHLRSLGISTIQDLPVGDNLQEHIGTAALVYEANVTDFSLIRQTFMRLPIIFPSYLFGSGPMASTGAEALGYITSPWAPNGSPDVEIIYISGCYNDLNPYLRIYHGVSEKLYKEYWKPLTGRLTFTTWIMASYPKSRGRVRLRSRDPRDPPRLYNNFLSHPDDLPPIIAGINRSLEFLSTPAFKSRGVRLYQRKLPGCEHLKLLSDAYWECVVRTNTVQYHHQCCTARMGPGPDAVVDSRLRVYGIAKLRVADASIMPSITAGHTTVPSYVIGEKAADLILEDSNHVWG